MNLRPRQRQPFSGFTKAQVEKMEHLLKDKEETLDEEFYKKLARVFSRSIGRAGKPAVKWTEIQTWFQNRLQNCLPQETISDAPEKSPDVTGADTVSKVIGNHKAPKVTRVLRSSRPQRRVGIGDKVMNGVCSNKNSEDHCAQGRKISLNICSGEKHQDLSKLEFEARSPTDGAWYDVEKFLAHRFPSSGEAEVCVRYVGFRAEDDEWVNIKNDVRERSVPLDHSECQKVKVGDLVVCFQERKDQARYYDAHVIEIRRRLHDIRGCRCFFWIRYNHDNMEERVRLRRLCLPAKRSSINHSIP